MNFTNYSTKSTTNISSANDFSFINNADIKIKELNTLLIKLTEYKNVFSFIINILSKFEDTGSLRLLEISKLSLTTAIQIMEILEKHNSNFDSINNSLINLLIAKNSHSIADDEYYTKLIILQNNLSNYILEFENFKTSVIENNHTFQIFIDTEEIQNILINNNYSKSLDINNHSLNGINSNIDFNININIDNLKNNNTLIISEKDKKVYLPYTKTEIALYLEQFPNSYKSVSDVINNEFVLFLDYYMKSPSIARFREAYSLIRDRESKGIFDALKYALSFMFKYEVNPIIIAACKTQDVFEHYLECYEKNKMNEFTDFKIKFEVSPSIQYIRKNKFFNNFK